MQRKIIIAALCLLATAILCGAQTIPNTGATSASASSSPTGETTGTGTAGTGTAATGTAATGTMSTADPGTGTTVVTTPEAAKGLSSGAIAGIVIGSIGGVALLGGGIYGLLKYTNKI